MKILTVCGSLKYQDEMMRIAEEKSLEGFCVLTPVFPVIKDIKITEAQLAGLKEAHRKRIELSDSVLIVNPNNYIGESTKSEIEYATELGKEVLYQY